MEKSDGSVAEEIVLQDLGTSLVQAKISDDLLEERQLQKSEGPSSDKVVESDSTSETQKVVQQEKCPTRDLLQNCEANEFPLQECKKVAKDEKNEVSDRIVQQKDESSFALKQDSIQTNRPDEKGMHQESDESLEEYKLKLQSEINLAKQQKGETEDRSIVSMENPAQTAEQEASSETQHSTGEDNSIASIEDSTQTAEQKASAKTQHRTVEYSSDVPIEGPTQTAEQEVNGKTQQGCNRTMNDDRSLLETATDPQFEARHESLQETSLPLPRRIRPHRTHVMPCQGLPPIQEEPDPPLSVFEVKFPIRRHGRLFGVRLPTLLYTGIRDYMESVRDRIIPPEARVVYDEFQTGCVKLFCGLLIGGFLLVVLYYLIEYLENTFGSNDDSNATTPLPDIPTTALNFDPFMTVSRNSMDDLDFSVFPVVNSMNANGIHPAIDTE